MMRATSTSWKNNPMPEQRERLPFKAVYSGEDVEKIKYGYIPEEMENKWFIYFDDNFLYFHRSWTGYCLFIVKFNNLQSKLEVADAWVSRDPSQWKSTDLQKDLDLLKILINNKLLKPSEGNTK